jgi:hypothetical protein
MRKLGGHQGEELLLILGFKKRGGRKIPQSPLISSRLTPDMVDNGSGLLRSSPRSSLHLTENMRCAPCVEISGWNGCAVWKRVQEWR